jgi:hypothetical protein
LSIFDTSCHEWNKFEEIIQIRHSFNHATEERVTVEITKAGPKLLLANDDFPENFWPLTKAPKDHRILNYEIAKELNAIIDWIIEKLKAGMPVQLNENYMNTEKAEIL